MSSPAERYERAFRSLLWRVRPSGLQRGVEFFMHQAAARTGTGSPTGAALQQVYVSLRDSVIRRLSGQRRPAGGRAREQTRRVLEASIPAQPQRDSADFHCDCGLGGLARWLRAAGYDARFWTQIDDDQLLQQTSQSSAILITTDRPLMARAAVKWGAVAALLAPLDAGKREQFRFVAGQLRLPRRTPRCMSCGGVLRSVSKEVVRDRIPPRTYPWRDDYCECQRCGKLFWKGTHWQHVEGLLAECQPRPGD